MTDSKGLRCIIAGFEPFGGADINPSKQCVERLPGLIEHGGSSAPVPVSPLVLPTCCLEAWAAVDQFLKGADCDDFILLLSGFAASRQRISLERFALNVREYRIADNGGHQWQQDYIQEGGSEALRTKVPLKELSAHLEGLGLLCEISNCAGTFVCNEIYYRALAAWENDVRCKAVLFVHLPGPELYLQLLRANSREVDISGAELACAPVDHYLLALTETVRFLADNHKQGEI